MYILGIFYKHTAITCQVDIYTCSLVKKGSSLNTKDMNIPDKVYES